MLRTQRRYGNGSSVFRSTIWSCSPAKDCADSTGLRNAASLSRSFSPVCRQRERSRAVQSPSARCANSGSESDLRAEEPTTDGLIATLSGLDLRERRVGVQLYPGNPNTRFTDFLRQAGATPDPVLPYIYASAAVDEKVVELIDRMADGGVDAIAFTSSPQVQRLFEVAAAARREEPLRAALQGIQIGAVGPLVAQELRRRGVGVTITPGHGYFMKPLVSAFLAAFSR